jgi:hypothetical protein
MIVSLRTRTGQIRGSLRLYREPRRPLFSDEERTIVKAVSPILADGANRALLINATTDPEGPHTPGSSCGTPLAGRIILSGRRLRLTSRRMVTGGVGRLPPAVLAVAGQAFRAAQGQRDRQRRWCPGC